MSGDIPLTRGGRLFIAFDNSGSMNDFNRLQTAREGTIAFLEDLKASDTGLEAIRFVRFNNTTTETEVARAGGLIGADYDTIIAYVQTLTTAVNDTNYQIAVASAPTFFAGIPTDDGCDNDLFMIFMSDGTPTQGNFSTALSTIQGIDGLQVFAFNIGGGATSFLAQMDNTPIDGLPNVEGGDTESFTNGFRQAFSQWPQFEGLDVVGDCSDTAGLTGGIERPAEYVGSDLGGVDIVDRRDITERRHTLRLTMKDKRAIWQRKRWLSDVGGRLNEFWYRGAQRDFRVAQAAAAGASDVVVDEVRLTPAELINLPIWIGGGARRVTAAIDLGASYQLTFGSAFDVAVPVETALSSLRRCRLSSDRVTINHVVGRASVASIPLLEVIT